MTDYKTTNMKRFTLLFIFTYLFLFTCTVSAQTFSRRDSLQGGLRPERTCFDVRKYDLSITIEPDKKYISGYNTIAFITTTATKRIQLDLFENMKVDSIVFNGKQLRYTRDYDAVFIDFPETLPEGTLDLLKFYYSGYPKIAKNAPWDGGFVFSEDNNGKPWVGVAVQGTGASLWYPVKDHQSDEPEDGAFVDVAVPNGLMCVSNGRLAGSEDLKNGYTRWYWEVRNPINNYDITVNIGDYVHIHDNLNGLDLDYYVLRDNKDKAKRHFEEVKPMLECFQEKFGEYPFKQDGYKLVETPYLGMEHQSAVAYGNKYRKGYLGRDLSFSGVGMLFDFIIIHETGHEWFGNSITSKDIADMWIHEAFTTYAESVYIECRYGYDKAMKYINGQGMNVMNDKPVIGIFGVNNEGSSDMYYKGALMLNTIRHIINDDEKWWSLILNFANTYKKQVISGETVVAFFNKESGMDLTPVFNQYLQYRRIPKLQLRQEDNELQYRWVTDAENFTMPMAIKVKGKEVRLNGTNNWQTAPLKIKNLNKVEVLKSEFYIKIEKL